jgi:hypothetical protein
VGGTGAANGNGKQQHTSRDSLAEEKAFATLGIRGVPSRQMHADRRHKYVRCTVDWREGEKGKHPEMLSIIWWNNMRQTVPSLFDDRKWTGFILHATPCTTLPLDFLSDKFWNNGCALYGAWQSVYAIKHRALISTSTSTPIADVMLAFLAHFPARYRFHDSPHLLPNIKSKRGCWC